MTSDITFTKTITNDPGHFAIGAGTYIITLFTTKVDENYEKAPILYDIPVPKARWGVTHPQKYAIDLLQLNHVFAITGHIHSTSGSKNSTPTSTSLNAKKYLIALFEHGGQFVMAYDGTSYNVQLRKMMITEGQHDQSTAAEYTVTIDAVEAIDK